MDWFKFFFFFLFFCSKLFRQIKFLSSDVQLAARMYEIVQLCAIGLFLFKLLSQCNIDAGLQAVQNQALIHVLFISQPAALLVCWHSAAFSSSVGWWTEGTCGVTTHDVRRERYFSPHENVKLHRILKTCFILNGRQKMNAALSRIVSLDCRCDWQWVQMRMWKEGGNLEKTEVFALSPPHRMSGLDSEHSIREHS